MGSDRESTTYSAILTFGLAFLLLSAVVAISLATEPVILMWANPI